MSSLADSKVFRKVGQDETGVGALTFLSLAFNARPQQKARNQEQIQNSNEDSPPASKVALVHFKPDESVTYLNSNAAGQIWPFVEEAVDKTQYVAERLADPVERAIVSLV